MSDGMPSGDIPEDNKSDGPTAPGSEPSAPPLEPFIEDETVLKDEADEVPVPDKAAAHGGGAGESKDDAHNAPDIVVSGIVQVPYLNGTYVYAGSKNNRPMWKLKQSLIGEAGLAMLSAFGGARGWIFYKTGSGKPGRWKIGTRGFEQISQADHPSMHSGCKWPCGAKFSALAPETITIQSA